MNFLLYFLIPAGHGITGPFLWAVNIILVLLVALLLWLVLQFVAKKFQVPPDMVQVIGLILFILLILSLFVGCTTQTPTQKAFNAFIAAQAANTDVTGTISGEGVSVTAGRINGRNSVAVGVDAKQVVRAINR